jgi:hypothetical protein
MADLPDLPDLPLCSAFGQGPEEALAEVLKAKAAWMEAAQAEGKPIPPPSFKPVIYQLERFRFKWLRSCVFSSLPLDRETNWSVAI